VKRLLAVALLTALCGCVPSSSQTPPAPPAPVIGQPETKADEVDRKAVIIGINQYPGCPLSYCVNDALSWQARLISKHGFRQEQIRMLLDKQATTQAYRDALKWLVAGAKPGSVRFHAFSGHGAEFSGDSSQPDGLHQVVCPQDFAWDFDHMITDTDFVRVFSQMPDGVAFCWISDSCHSGDLTRGSNPHAARRWPKAPPPQVQRNLDRARRAGWKPRGFVNGILDVGFISGCSPAGTSADSGEFKAGAATWSIEQAMDALPAACLTDLAAKANALLREHGYEQAPQAEGAQKDAPFLQGH